MSYGWENHEAAPLEEFHSILLEEFHKLRKEKGENEELTLTLDGIEFNNLIAKAKTVIYAKYPKQVNNNAILKTEM